MNNQYIVDIISEDKYNQKEIQVKSIYPTKAHAINHYLASTSNAGL